MAAAATPVSDLLSWLIIGGAVLAPPLAFVGFLLFFRTSRSDFRKSVVCPETGEKADIEVTAREGAQGPYRDIRSCSLLEGEVTCGKSCLNPDEFLEAPFKPAPSPAKTSAKPGSG